jgi:hypothetical protein
MKRAIRHNTQASRQNIVDQSANRQKKDQIFG